MFVAGVYSALLKLGWISFRQTHEYTFFKFKAKCG